MTMRLLPLLLLLSACASTPAQTSAPATKPATTTTDRAELAFLPYPRVDYWVDRFSNGDKHAELAAAFARMPEVESMIREKLRRKGMPEDLLYMAVIESGLNPAAHSTADAKGIWQLVPATATRWGLRVDDTVDERTDAAKATDAALSYLSYLYNRFGSWYLAAAAYNSGENRVARVMTEETGSEAGTDADYYRVWDKLPGETRDFVPVMIAAATIGHNRAKYGF